MYKNYYLDLEKVASLTNSEQDRIHDYYREMLMMENEKRSDIAGSFFNTLYQGGYLKEIRDEKIDQILS